MTPALPQPADNSRFAAVVRRDFASSRTTGASDGFLACVQEREQESVDLVDVGGDSPHVRDVFITHEHKRGAKDLAEPAVDRGLEGFLLFRARVPRVPLLL